MFKNLQSGTQSTAAGTGGGDSKIRVDVSVLSFIIFLFFCCPLTYLN